MSYLNIDPCVPAVQQQPSSSGGIIIDCIETETSTSTVNQDVYVRYIDATSVSANQVACTTLILGGDDKTNVLNNVKASNSLETTVNSDLSVNGYVAALNLDVGGDTTTGTLSINLEGEVHSVMSRNSISATGSNTITLASSIPSWVNRVQVHLYKVTRNTTATRVMQLYFSDAVTSTYLIGEEGRINDTASGISYASTSTKIDLHASLSGWQADWPVTEIIEINYVGYVSGKHAYSVRINGMAPNYGNRWQTAGYHDITGSKWSFVNLYSGGTETFKDGIASVYYYM